MEKRVKVLRMWKVDMDADYNVVLKDCDNRDEQIIYHDMDGDDSPVDVAVQYLNRKGVHITHYAVDSDFSVVLLSEK
jgi:hypothetical protein